jgi:uncharacterized membrane protein
MFQGLRFWLIGGFLAILSIFGLFLSAHGGTQDAYALGIGLFLFCVAGLAYLLRAACDAEARH